MRFTSLAVIAASAIVVHAQTQYQIFVGANGTLTYSPPNITAAVGDLVTFVFRSGNHTVSQSLFDTPCDQFVNTSISDPSKQNLTSGFMPVSADATTFPVWTIQITQTTPFWFFCAHQGHCPKGMVGSVNANESSNKTYEAFKEKALGSASPTSTTSGGGAGTHTGTPTGTATKAATPNQPKGAAPARFGLHAGGGVGVAFVGVALGLAL